ncbi:Reticulocyte-binding 2 a [Gossypium arboreum]|uniref:Reticulocyte-binding 2 a n=3 Tax=Gossypium arboreum TaxID=29729 RepID=A0A0B0NP03_GOSAR|nr:uncharacterized protein LOC108465783 isoform X1 [Gossypium arboreum]KAK5811890.1 hypothetical protein PVK06_027273 [Gossypium arboreum]KHG14590.1 Reticulocyte-binding 2 a [Gossypium arboreum]
MASTSASWSPSSPQLRLAFRCRNCREPRPLLLLDYRRPRLLSVSLSRTKELERRRNVASRIVSDSTAGADTFSGWSDSDTVEDSIGSGGRRRFGGIMGAGSAGLVLVAGFSFAAMSLSNRSTSRPKQQLEPLTAQQEVSFDNDSEQAKENEIETGTHKDLSAPTESSGTSENNLDNDNGTYLVDSSTSNGDSASNTSSIQEYRQNVSSLDGESAFLDTTPISPNLPESDAVGVSSVASNLRESDSNLDIGSPEATSEIEDKLISVQETIDTNLSDPINLDNDLNEGKLEGKENSSISVDSSSSSNSISDPSIVGFSVSSELEPILEPQAIPEDNLETTDSSQTKENLESRKMSLPSVEIKNASLEDNKLNESESSQTTPVSAPAHSLTIEQSKIDCDGMKDSIPDFESPTPRSSFSPVGIPAPSAVSADLQVHPGEVLVPAVVDQFQEQALAALRVLKVIEAEALPGELCTRREYARWLVAASSALSRNVVSKVYPAMYVENVTELAFDDIIPEDPDFSSIQGLAEAGLISSKLSNQDLLNYNRGPVYFSPESPLSRQDLVSWKMALEKRQLPEADREILYQLSGFIDIDKINPDAWPALVADLSTGEPGIIALAFGCTRLFQPNKPVTKAQAAVAIATGEASDLVSEELARIEAESVAENAVSAHNALVAEVEKDVNANFEKELSIEREKIDAFEKMAEEAKRELERIRAEREEENMVLMKDRAAISAETKILSRLRREVEEQLETMINDKVEISYERERISKLRKETEDETQEIVRLQHELEVERKALSMARAWAEDEAKRAREQAKALEEAREQWERQGVKVVVDNDLHEESVAGDTWVNVGKQVAVEGTISRGETLVGKLKILASEVKSKSREFIDKIVQRIQYLISVLRKWASDAGAKAEELKDGAVLKARGSVQEMQQTTAGFSSAVKEGAKRVAGDCREGVEKLTQRFRT